MPSRCLAILYQLARPCTHPSYTKTTFATRAKSKYHHDPITPSLLKQQFAFVLVDPYKTITEMPEESILCFPDTIFLVVVPFGTQVGG